MHIVFLVLGNWKPKGIQSACLLITLLETREVTWPNTTCLCFTDLGWCVVCNLSCKTWAHLLRWHNFTCFMTSYYHLLSASFILQLLQGFQMSDIYVAPNWHFAGKCRIWFYKYWRYQTFSTSLRRWYQFQIKAGVHNKNREAALVGFY